MVWVVVSTLYPFSRLMDLEDRILLRIPRFLSTPTSLLVERLKIHLRVAVLIALYLSYSDYLQYIHTPCVIFLILLILT